MILGGYEDDGVRTFGPRDNGMDYGWLGLLIVYELLMASMSPPRRISIRIRSIARRLIPTSIIAQFREIPSSANGSLQN